MDNYPPGADTPSAPWNQTEPTDRQLSLADEVVIHEQDLYPEWMLAWTGNREPSTFFGPISNPELFRVQMSSTATLEQVREASQELRNRFLVSPRVSEAAETYIRELME